ncbi:MAG TPA: hypothetical protein VGM50_09360 [Gemmatimonadaceae bacterium]
MPKRTIISLIAISALGAAGVLTVLRPRPTRLALTARVGDDTVIINQTHPAKLGASVLNQYGRLMRRDTAVRYHRIGGDAITLSSSGVVQCTTRSDAVVRAEFQSLAREFLLRCRPVTWIEAPSWLDLVTGDSTRDLSFTARGPDGHAVTELRGAVVVENASIVAATGTTVRAKRPGTTFAHIEIGDAKANIPIMVYRLVTSFAGNPARSGLLAMRVKLARGDTIELPVPKAAFWVTYLPSNRNVAPPTIELRGEGSCTTGNGIRARRIEDDKYAKYCLAGTGTQMMVAHGATGPDTVAGTIALRIMW